MQAQNKSVMRQFLHYTIPSVTGMAVSSLYTVVDGIFVGRGVGSQALAAVNIVYPFIMLQIAVSMLCAVGGANLFSIQKGRGDDKSANTIFCQSLLFVGLLAFVVNLAAILFSAPLCRLLGADDTLLPLSQEYLRIVAGFGVIYMPGLLLGIFVRNDGAPGREMAGTLAGAIANIILDWAFIMVFGWGLAGAAIATGIGQVLSFIICAGHLFGKKGSLRVSLTRLRPGILGRILFNGLPSFLMEFSQSAITLSFNIAMMAHIGVIGVSAYSIVMYICSIFNMMLIGITQGAQPIISFSHGRGDDGTLGKVHRYGILASLLATTFFYLVTLVFGGPLCGLFVKDDGAIATLAVQMMRLYFLGFFPTGISLMNILVLQATEHEAPSILLSCLRCIGFVQLFLLVLPGLFGNAGIYLALLFGEACTALLSVALVHRVKTAAPTPGRPKGLRKPS